MTQFTSARCKGEVYELDGTLANTVMVELSWSVQDAWAIGMIFGAGGEDNVWHFGIDLVLNAMENEGTYVGEGDVHVRFAGDDFWVGLKAERDMVMVKCVPGLKVREFLAQTGLVMKAHMSVIAKAISDELDTLLAEA